MRFKNAIPSTILASRPAYSMLRTCEEEEVKEKEVEEVGRGSIDSKSRQTQRGGECHAPHHTPTTILPPTRRPTPI
jgi:hypothetical protein